LSDSETQPTKNIGFLGHEVHYIPAYESVYYRVRATAGCCI